MEGASPSPAGAVGPSEDLFHQLVDAVTDYAICILDRDGRVVTWNRGAERTKGYTAPEIVGSHLSVFYTDEDRAAGRPERNLETVREVGRCEDEGWRVRKDGSRFWADVVLTLLQDKTGAPIGFAKVTRDLSEKRAAHEALMRSEERFRLLVESVTDYAIYMLDPQGSITTWNRGAERMKGYASTEIIGKRFSVFFPPEDVKTGKPDAELAMASQNGRFEDEGWRVRKDGTRFWANVIVTALRDSRGQLIGFGKVTRDLTARREAEETERTLFREQAARSAAEDLAKRAEETIRMRDEFLATISHELRTPLNAIIGWAAMIRTEQVSPQIRRGLDIIDRNAKAQVKLVEDILDVSRIVTGKLQIEAIEFDLISIAGEALEVVRPSAAAKRIELEFTSSAPVVMRGDPERLRQLIWNLLANAVKFTGEGGHVSLDVTERERMALVRVRDDGLGIEPDFLPYVFERFRQGDASTTRRFGGLGLGLTIVRSIAEAHGGLVRAESAGLGLGSTFSVEVPIHNVGEDRKPKRATPSPAATPVVEKIDLTGIRILVVEDEDDARELFEEVLTNANGETKSAASVTEAIELLELFRPHILVSDIGLPGEDGYSLARRIRALPVERGGQIPSVALTAYTRNEDRLKAIDAGFTTHVAKPINPSELLAAVNNLVGLIRPRASTK